MTSHATREPLLALLLTCCGASLPGVVAAQGADGQWTTPAGTPQGTRYSNLTEITPNNAHSLVEEFSFPTGATAFISALNVSIPATGPVGGGAVDGTSSFNQTNLSVLNQSITNWPPGTALWLVWQMTDSSGNAQGLA